MDNIQKILNDSAKIVIKNKRYIIRTDKVDELKEGKTNIYLSKITHYSRQYLCEIFTGKRIGDKKMIKNIIIPISKESVKIKEKYEEKGLDYLINYFFKEI
jgi:hypothetical protein